MNVNGRITFAKNNQQVSPNYHVNPSKDVEYPKREDIEDQNECSGKKSSLQQLSEKVHMVQQRLSKKNIIRKINQVHQSIYQLIFLKQTIMSMLNEQKLKTGDFIRDIKKYIFQLQMKFERGGIERQSKMSGEQRQSRVGEESNVSINLNNIQRSIVISHSMDTSKEYAQLQRVNVELQRKCQELTRENEELKAQFQKSLLKYQEQINYLASDQQIQVKDTILVQENQYLKLRIEQGNQILKKQQQRYKQKIQYLQNEIIGLEDQYLKEKEATDRDLRRYRQKQKLYTFQETELERKNILLIEREKAIFQRQNLVKQERNAMERRENKISDYEHNQMRRQKQNKEVERNNLRSQYYGTLNNIPAAKHQLGNRIHTTNFTERERSASSRYINSGLDINARLKEIEQEKRKLGFNGGKNSRISEAGYRRPTQNRSLSRQNYNLKPVHQGRNPVGTSNVNSKLSDMLSNLQQDLNDIK